MQLRILDTLEDPPGGLWQESKKHEDESVCCQGFLVPVNAGVVLMRQMGWE